MAVENTTHKASGPQNENIRNHPNNNLHTPTKSNQAQKAVDTKTNINRPQMIRELSQMHPPTQQPMTEVQFIPTAATTLQRLPNKVTIPTTTTTTKNINAAPTARLTTFRAPTVIDTAPTTQPDLSWDLSAFYPNDSSTTTIKPIKTKMMGDKSQSEFEDRMKVSKENKKSVVHSVPKKIVPIIRGNEKEVTALFKQTRRPSLPHQQKSWKPKFPHFPTQSPEVGNRENNGPINFKLINREKSRISLGGDSYIHYSS